MSEVERLHDSPLLPVGRITDKPGSGGRPHGKPADHDDPPGAGSSGQPQQPDEAGSPSAPHRNPDFLLDEYA